ncbi:MAG: hypothetical protein ACTSRG_01340 [Candidatus Helarchaeota archaeon]
MSNRKKIKKIEETIDENKDISEEYSLNKDNKQISKRKEAIIIEEKIEKEMEERMKKREKKEKILYEENRLKRFVRENREGIRIFLIGFFIFLLITMGLFAALGLRAFLGVSTQEILLLISGSLLIIGTIILIFIGQRYLLK